MHPVIFALKQDWQRTGRSLAKNISLIVYGFSFVVGATVFITTSSGRLGFGLTQWYGLLSTVYLYLTLLISPLYNAFPQLPYRRLAVTSRAAIGVSSVFFGLLHGYYGFYGFVGGFAGLKVWSLDFTISLLYGLIALAILAVLAVTSIPRLKRAMGPYWKRVHRWVYTAGVLIILHSVTVTIHLLHIPVYFAIGYLSMGILLYLETVRIGEYLARTKHDKARTWIWWGYGAVMVVLCWMSFFWDHHRH